MRLYGLLVLCLTSGLLFGCQENRTAAQESQNLDAELVKTLNTIGVENAIIAQHTLYPYHFVPDGDELNTLGQRDLAVLAQHFKSHGGTLNVRRADTGAELYQARVAQVLAKLKEAAVDTNRLTISDSMPGGDGVTSERVIVILSRAAEGAPEGVQAPASVGMAVR
jgi:hypothetical protein